MPIEIFLFFEIIAKEEEIAYSGVPERERNKKGKGVCEKTHRHFDASGRLPADFHVEEHDWVGHDDDFDSKKKE